MLVIHHVSCTCISGGQPVCLPWSVSTGSSTSAKTRKSILITLKPRSSDNRTPTVRSFLLPDIFGRPTCMILCDNSMNLYLELVHSFFQHYQVIYVYIFVYLEISLGDNTQASKLLDFEAHHLLFNASYCHFIGHNTQASLFFD